VAARLREREPGLAVECVPISTEGDKLLDAPLAKVGGKGLFIKALEAALLDERADLAVHSMKDVTVDLPAGLHIPVITARADPCDALVSRAGRGLDALASGARVGTSSLRRKCQLSELRPDLELIDLRGGVNTRLRKLDEGLFDAIVLAVAGLERLGLAGRISERFAPERLLPAVGQGALGIECRQGDSAMEALIAPLAEEPSASCVRAERAMNRRLGGGCQVPIAGYARPSGDGLELLGLVARLDGSEILRERDTTMAGDEEALGRRVAERLLERGAGAILESVYAGG